MTVREVVREIAKSQEHTQRFWRTESGEETPYFRATGTLYRHLLSRQPDAAGARHWAERGAQQGPAFVVDQVTSSAEYNNQFGDWGVPGSGGLRYCGPNNQGASVSTPSTSTSTSTSTNARANMGRRFRGMDRNNDGVISQREWRGSPRSFEVHDWNNDGVLSGDEVEPGSARVGRTLEDEDFDRAEQFEYLDTNNNGRIELREWHSTAGAFERLDANNDNSLSRREFTFDTTSGVAATSGQSVVVDSRRDWTDTGLTVRAGDMIFLNPSGTVRLSDNGNDVATPSGSQSGRRAADAPLRRAPAGGLIARIGNSNISYVGDRQSFRAPSSGRLYLGVNDDYLDDNSGEFRVIVDVQER